MDYGGLFGCAYPHCACANGTQLCDMDVLLQHSFGNVAKQSEWVSNMCARVLTDCTHCRCGYCKQNGGNGTSDGRKGDGLDVSCNFILVKDFRFNLQF